MNKKYLLMTSLIAGLTLAGCRENEDNLNKISDDWGIVPDLEYSGDLDIFCYIVGQEGMVRDIGRDRDPSELWDSSLAKYHAVAKAWKEFYPNIKINVIYGGIEDIKNKVIKTIETPDFVFAHDGLRILRLFRFECELNFKIDKETLLSAIKFSSNVKDISGERVIHEITCILHSGKRYPGYSKANSYLRAFKQFNKYKLWTSFGIDCAKIKLKMVKKVEHKSQGFLIDLIDTVKPISISYYLNLILVNFGLNKKMVSLYINVLSGYYDALNRLQNKEYFFKYFDNFPLIYKLLVHKSKYLANKYNFFYKYIISHKLIITTKELKVSGEDIKKYYPTVKPYRYNAILASLLSDVFEGKLENDSKTLIKAIEQKLKYL